jgi:hypothetical protein
MTALIVSEPVEGGCLIVAVLDPHPAARRAATISNDAPAGTGEAFILT